MKKFTTDTFFLMRVDSPENIDRDFYQNRLTFSCPANWLDYALKQNDETIGDRYECIFAHLDASDERRLNVKNSHGELLQDQYSITASQIIQCCCGWKQQYLRQPYAFGHCRCKKFFLVSKHRVLIWI